jgi:hypothetical protein
MVMLDLQEYTCADNGWQQEKVPLGEQKINV